jgi:hypothetical protein
MSDDPTTYNDIVALVENNEPGVVASVIQETHTSNKEIREVVAEIRSWAEQYADDYAAMSALQKSTVADYQRCADEMEKLVDNE